MMGRKRLLLTGAKGFVGSHSVRPALTRGFEVHGVTSKPPSSSDSEVIWHRADLLQPAQLLGVIREVKPSHLLHAAWFTAPGLYWTSRENVRWLRAGLLLLEEFVHLGGTRAVYVGTCAEYDWNYGFCSEAVTPCQPNTLYGACKHALHLAAAPFAQAEHVSFGWARLFFPYGPGEHPSRFVPSVTRALLSGCVAPCTDGRQIRDFIHVEDAGSALAAFVDGSVEGAVNIASGIPTTVRAVAELIAAAVGRPDHLHMGAIPRPADDPPVLFADTQRLKRDVGWQPTYNLENGLRDTVAWWDRLLEKD